MEITRHLLFNLSLLMIYVYFSHMWTERQNTISLSRRGIALFYIAGTVISLAFPFKLSCSLHLDMGLIPVILGGLYAGLGPQLALFTMVARGVYGLDTSFVLQCLQYFIIGLALWKLYPWFSKQKLKFRIQFAVGFCAATSLLTMISLEISTPVSHSLEVWLAYLIILPIGTCLIAYSIEFVRKNLLLRKHLIKTKKLEVVEQMGAAISHEIRNPLTAANGFVQLLLEDNVNTSKTKEYLSLVKGELESAERVIQDYLTFSKPAMTEVEELNVKHELSHVLAIIQPMANKNSVEISVNFAAVGFIAGDRQKFRQCFLNVFKNAIEAMPSGGRLTIETQFTPSRVIVLVADTGIGMTKDQLERLGEPYYSTKEGKGTGLGMMVVYSIVRAMKGTLKVESRNGGGTTFHFSFPSRKDNRL
ncbi:sensor histidine kinase [Mesobacillus zeae]|uniref:histidine kinase n=1 Tax=Mesobacillus zeae TaxID=1917180 RepID=A0A398BER4_9BACI|nr:HAMP domain-containing sensor histidine kinase [Mesobacillus zeae]RID87761.1 sensor histidine kinase [Mesobacillus zeae]